jgi:hypothetical protein
MMQDDDELWLDALAGRATPDSAAAREGRETRAAMLARDVGNVEVEQRDAAREQTLIERARRDGVLPIAGAERQKPSSLRLSLATAAIVCLALGFWAIERPRDNDAFVVRSAPDGSPNGTVRIESNDPEALKRRLLSDLRAAGVSANGYQRLGAQGIDADLPEILPEKVAAVLDRYHLAPPAEGVLRVEIAAPSR